MTSAEVIGSPESSPATPVPQRLAANEMASMSAGVMSNLR